MNRPFILFSVLSLLMVFHLSPAKDLPQPERTRRPIEVIHGGPADPAKALTDTAIIMGPWGSDAPHNGQFETSVGEAAWNGWTHLDKTAPRPESAWHVSPYNAAFLHGQTVGNLAAYCGDPAIPACANGDTIGGYLNQYFEVLQWEGTVADTTQGCRLDLTAWLNYDLEPGYDYLLVRLVLGDGSVETLASYTSRGANENLQVGFDLQPGDYVGEAGNGVRLRLIVTSDGAYSDQGCKWPTKGACQVDDIAVTLDNGGTFSFTDFEDGTLGAWETVVMPGVGDFAHLVDNLQDIDPCVDNTSWQVCFVDDGVVVPGTGGTPCITWCYGPSGYVVYNSNGQYDRPDRLHNTLISPPMAWPDGGYNGGTWNFDAYYHETLGGDSAGILVFIQVRSTISTNPDDLDYAAWVRPPFSYYGEGYRRMDFDFGQYLVEGVTYFQVSMDVYEMSTWGWYLPDGTPAPYFDNVRLTAFRHGGPLMYTWPNTLAQDAFPTHGLLDLSDPGSNHVGFDTPGWIESDGVDGVVHGDSLVCYVAATGSDNYLQGLPRLYYRLKANPVFDPYRTAGLPSVGFVEGDSVVNNGAPEPGYYEFHLPDEGFLFPGDELHYFFEATQWDPVQGYTTSILPADTTGFSDFSAIAAYGPLFSFRALPDVVEDGGLLRQRAKILYWEDTGVGADQLLKWEEALEFCNVGLQAEFDVFYSNTDGAEEAGLGHSATVDQLGGYDFILHNSGQCDRQPLGEGTGQFADFSPDIPLLDAWLRLGDKGMLFSGDDVIWNPDIRETWCGLSYVPDPVGPMIGNQISPQVAGTDNPYLGDLAWTVFGGCPDIRTIAAVEALPGTESLAEFLSPNGTAGIYPYAAGAGRWDPTSGSRVVTLPYALERVEGAQALDGSFTLTPVRAEILSRLLEYLQVPGKIVDTPPDAGVLSAAAYPNPFNPAVRIDFNLPLKGRVQVKVYNLKGQLVRTLLDEPREPGLHHILWSGEDDSDRQGASGVYFYEVIAGGEKVLGKVTMLK